MRTMRKICRQCGQAFFTTSMNKEYCDSQCKKKANLIKTINNIQPCWSCKNCSDICPWINHAVPITNWNAEKTTIKDSLGNAYNTFKINSCPNYICEV